MPGHPVAPQTPLRICVFGPESTGKTTLARRLAEHFGAPWVPEAARGILEAQRGALGPEDFPRIARAQARAEDEAAASDEARRSGLLFCDTDVLTTMIWSEVVLQGRCQEPIRREAARRRYPLTLLCEPDVPWVDDIVRYQPEAQARRAFFERCRRALQEHGRRFHIVQGSWEERWQSALGACEQALRTGTLARPTETIRTREEGAGDGGG